jgi:hypothetical protein
MKRPCVFLVADGTMAQVLKKFLEREYLEERLGCRTFDFNFQQDVVVDVKNGNTDGGIHRRAHELLRPYQRSHQNALVMLDQSFGGERPAGEVRAEILTNLQHNGWSAACAEVVVIDPELEIWLWQRGSPHVARAFRHSGPSSLEELLETQDFWPSGALKPSRPKDAANWLLRRYRPGAPIVVYGRIVASVSVGGCQDPIFNLLVNTLRRWFPL